jgi:PhnB protein
MEKLHARLHPRLIVTSAERAIEFYQQAFGAEEIVRYTDPKIGRVVHAEISIDGLFLSLSDEDPASKNQAPPGLGGSPVILTLDVTDADAVGARMQRAGAKVVFPIADQFYGKREGRLVDPFGHVWIVSQQIEELSPDEIRRRIAALWE